LVCEGVRVADWAWVALCVVGASWWGFFIATEAHLRRHAKPVPWAVKDYRTALLVLFQVATVWAGWEELVPAAIAVLAVLSVPVTTIYLTVATMRATRSARKRPLS
jgi:hypothetical protein